MIDSTHPFDARTARQIARAFLPQQWSGNRYDYYYAQVKLRTDPLYPGVLAALRGSRAPVLDLGCGLGLLAHALRADGQTLPYLGVDVDTAKIRRARAGAARSRLDNANFQVLDLDGGAPLHSGSVTILDLLQYLPSDRQRDLLATTTAMLTPGARLVVRTGLADDTRRSDATWMTDRLAHTFGWMRQRPGLYPTREGLQMQLRQAGLAPVIQPLYGRTPFNNWLIVATR